MFRSCLFVLLLSLYVSTMVGCDGDTASSGGTNTFADMTPDEWAEYNAEQERIQKEQAAEMP
ncbi:hypothetical protein Q31b_45920 [Novipirellula aureliae]|uniref:Secreted protein n=1 Tax=Novipirellula aureliae TaxID=2527966 RepID=A0A5C6DKC0_9BACT|nr:hypothetical protein [Novipirellula aureliae]TWU37803.1 hypothetical protein Q31b_45920 [Novipirellula aureliae]